MSLAIMPSSVRPLVSHALIAALVLSAAMADRAESQTTSPFMQPVAGVAPGPIAGTYPLSGFDNVNLYNGNLSLHLPIFTVGGRGEAGYTMTLALDSRRWTATAAPCDLGGGQGCAPFVTAERLDNGWPWPGEVGYGPGRLELRQSTQHPDLNFCSEGTTPPTGITRLVFKAPDGSEIVFRDGNGVDADGNKAKGRPELATCQTIGDGQFAAGFNRRTKWVSMDGISASYENETDLIDCPGVTPCELPGQPSPLSGYLMFRDGRHYRIDAGQVSYIYDRNGNKVSFTYDVRGVIKIVDSLNREIHVDYNLIDPSNNAYYDAISYYGAQGDPTLPTTSPQSRQRVIKVYRYQLDQVLRPAGANGEEGYPEPLTYAELFPDLSVDPGYAGVVYDPGRFPFNPADRGLPGYVILPNGTFYKFLYNPHAEVAEVDVPTGGSYHYDYVPDYSTNDIQGQGYFILGRRLAARRTYDDHGLRSTTSYSTAYQTSPQLLTHITANENNSQGGLERRTEHFFYGYPRLVPTGPLAESDWSEGKEYKTQVLTAGGTLLRQTEQTWFQEPLPWWPHPDMPLTGPLNSPVVTATQTTLDGGLVSKETFGHDSFSNVTDVWEYDFGSGAPGSLLRHRQTTYVTSNSKGDYVESFPGSYPGLHARSLPAEEKVFDGQGVLRSYTTYQYDEGPLVTRPNMSGASVSDPGISQ
jgi:hypothetical protein